MNLADMVGLRPAEVEAALDRLKADPAGLKRVYEIAKELGRRQAQTRWEHFFPDETHEWRGETFHAREGYRKHLAFFRATASYTEVCFRAGNRVGKTNANGYACSVFATGRYPKWWEGRRWDRPTDIWMAGKTYETTRDILQRAMFGAVIGKGQGKRFAGDGLIPGDAIGDITWRSGVNDLADTVKIRHVSGRWSTIGLKAYEQGRGAFEGTSKDVAAVDEEVPMDVYTELLTRLMTTRGLMMLSFTPLDGVTETTMRFEEDMTEEAA